MRLKILGVVVLILVLFLLVAWRVRATARMERTFSAPASQVWTVWTDPGAMKKWWGPKGYTAPAIQSDLRVGGKYLWAMQSPKGELFWSTGVFKEVMPNERIVATMSFADEHGNAIPGSKAPVPGHWPNEITVITEFRESAGKTTVTVTEVGIPLIVTIFAKVGWAQQFDKIQSLLTPGSDRADLSDNGVYASMFDTDHPAETKTGYAPVNGLSLYYEIHGTGEALILLHGGLGSTAAWNELVPLFAKSRRVIAVDLQAHGRTADIDRPITCEAMADDIAALAKYLSLQKADVMGYSLGGCVALQTTIRHPDLVRKLVIVSTVFRHDGWYPEILAQMAQMSPASAEMMKPSPIYKTYTNIAPRPEDFPKLVGKVADLLRKDYDWAKDVAAIKAPTMLVFGDADAIRPQHMVEFYGLLGGGKKDAGWDGSGLSAARMAVLPGATHYNILESPLLPAAISPFLDIPIAAS